MRMGRGGPRAQPCPFQGNIWRPWRPYSDCAPRRKVCCTARALSCCQADRVCHRSCGPRPRRGRAGWQTC
eukprot:4127231-Pyramimonas_sp.AAC.1